MSDDLENTQTIKRSTLIDEVNRTSLMLSDHIRDINSTTKWYSTVVLGVLAVVVKFNKDISELKDIYYFMVKGNYVFSILLIFISFLIFIYTMNKTNDCRIILVSRLSEIKEKILNIETIKKNEVQSIFLEIREINITSVDKFNPMLYLKLGWGFFGVGCFLILNYFIWV